ncbi:MAG: hypothetical protein A3A65_02945 [Candidatus Chisholmbacteria bacterium RIFCSPLOWO2_01_FULL_49_14]|uniref:Macrocin O-methyltransferase n=1 Tax=Candidatus Chisholmbacteria bacterium RIFCSPLOWO2_01_FULL_49_14 TaxID=1797593 RepID=A0A1G1W3L1_9BACT|nr:MAG: hypothetical protein A3A65_02945 [Candidatus Chisholmbacteria bacterium RIFCSPLOWO2_01_FULL_49_14]
MFMKLRKPPKSTRDLSAADAVIIKKVRAFSMLSPDRLENLLRLANEVVRGAVPGDFVECGACRGGSGAVVAHVAKLEGWKRNVWLFDSFMGHPEPSVISGLDSEIMKDWAGTMIASQADVRKALKTVDAYSEEHIRIVPGWFQDSLLSKPIREIALLHIDADWYDATLLCLEKLYLSIVAGGYLVIDDYDNPSFPGVKQAVREFFADKTKEISFSFEVRPALTVKKG